MSEKRKIIFSSVSGVIQLIVTAILTFVSIPVFMNKLGSETYGIFAVISVVGNLGLFTNLGINTSLTKFIAEQGKGRTSNLDIMVALIINLCILLPVTALAYVLTSFILIDILKIPSEYYVQAEQLFHLLLLSNAVILTGQIFTSVLDSLQRMYLTNTAQLIYSLFYWGGIIIVLFMGYGLVQVGYIILLASVLWFVLILFLLLKYWGLFTVRFSLEELKQHASKQVKYGLQVYSAGLVAFFNEPLFKIIISATFGLSAVAYFDIALKVRNQLSGLFHKLLSPMFPFMSQSNKGNVFLGGMIKDLNHKIFLLALPLAVILLLTCYDIVTLWLRTDIINYTFFIVGIVTPYIILSPLTLPVYLYLLAKGHPGKTIVMQASSVVVNLLFFYLFYRVLGIYAIILSNALSYLASYLLGIYYQYKYLDIKYFFDPKQVLLFVLLLLCFAAISGVRLFVSNEWLYICIIAVGISAVAVKYYKCFNFVSREDIERYFPGNKFITALYNKI